MGTLTDLAISASGDPRREIDRRLAHLEHRLAELDQLRHDLVEDAHALADAVHNLGPGGPPRSVFSIRDAAAELGVSVSLLHKLIKETAAGTPQGRSAHPDHRRAPGCLPSGVRGQRHPCTRGVGAPGVTTWSLTPGAWT